MNKNIKNGGNELIGLPNEVYTIKPAKQSNFEYSSKLNAFKEPQNFIEEIRGVFNNLFRNIGYITNQIIFAKELVTAKSFANYVLVKIESEEQINLESFRF